MKKAIEALKVQVQMLNAGEGHMKMEMEDNTVAVLSVYEGQRASNEILDDLVEWAEENNNQELLNKITTLAEI